MIEQLLLSAPDVQILADIATSDGTSNGIVIRAVRIVCALVAVALIGVSALRIFKVHNSDNPTKKQYIEELQYLGMAEGGLAVLWIVAEIGAQLFAGVATAG